MTLATRNTRTRKPGRTRYARAVQFFHTHAGFSYDPKTETKSQGKRRCARALAKAEAYASTHDWTYSWEDDWTIGDHQKEFDCYADGDPDTCESCILRDAEGKVLASIGCVDDASAEYRRVIQAELALEAMPADRGGL